MKLKSLLFIPIIFLGVSVFGCAPSDSSSETISSSDTSESLTSEMTPQVTGVKTSLVRVTNPEEKILQNENGYYHIKEDLRYKLVIDIETIGTSAPFAFLYEKDIEIRHDETVEVEKSPDNYADINAKRLKLHQEYVLKLNETDELTYKINVIVMDEYLSTLGMTKLEPVLPNKNVKLIKFVYDKINFDLENKDVSYLASVINSKTWKGIDVYDPSNMKGMMFGQEDGIDYLYCLDFINKEIIREDASYSMYSVPAKTGLLDDEVNKIKTIFTTAYEKEINKSYKVDELFPDLANATKENITKIKLIKNISGIAPGSLGDVYYFTKEDTTFFNEFLSLIHGTMKKTTESVPSGNDTNRFEIYLNDNTVVRLYIAEENLVSADNVIYKLDKSIPSFTKDIDAHRFVIYQGNYQVLDKDGNFIKDMKNLGDFEFNETNGDSYQSKEKLGTIETMFGWLDIYDNLVFKYESKFYALADGLTFKTLLA